ncbi:MAG: hypothetical protein J7K00_05670 [Candidatus Diapherotrites archaeon]|nr:hypothetical protein [Candidatus Diapherotrites archaeon]
MAGTKRNPKIKIGTGSKAGFKRGQAMLLDSLVFSMLVMLMLFYTVAFVSGFEGWALVWQKTVERQRVAFSVSELFLNDPGHPVDWTGFPDRFGLAFYDSLKRQVKESVVFLPEKRVVFLESLDSAMLNDVLDTGKELAVSVESDLVSVCFPREYCAENKGFAEKEAGWSGDCVVVSRIVSVKTESDVGVGVLRVGVCE